MKQISLATTRFELVTKRTRKRVFLDEMSLVVPWRELVGLIQPFAPTGTGAKGKQREQLRRVLGQPFVANLGEAELTLARALVDKLESAAGKAFLFHQRLTSEPIISITYADLP
jgi:hypothetical protein